MRSVVWLCEVYVRLGGRLQSAPGGGAGAAGGRGLGRAQQSQLVLGALQLGLVLSQPVLLLLQLDLQPAILTRPYLSHI
jgi:hypothetical protein